MSRPKKAPRRTWTGELSAPEGNGRTVVVRVTPPVRKTNVAHPALEEPRPMVPWPVVSPREALSARISWIPSSSVRRSARLGSDSGYVVSSRAELSTTIRPSPKRLKSGTCTANGDRSPPWPVETRNNSAPGRGSYGTGAVGLGNCGDWAGVPAASFAACGAAVHARAKISSAGMRRRRSLTPERICATGRYGNG